MKPYLLILIFLASACTVNRSFKRPAEWNQLHTLSMYMAEADTLTQWNDEYERIELVKDSIVTLLLEVLNNPKALQFNIDSLIPHSQSDNDKVHIFSVFHNTGGSWEQYTSILQYRDKDTCWAVALESLYGPVYKLTNTQEPYYLIEESVVGCNSCFMSTGHLFYIARDGYSSTTVMSRNYHQGYSDMQFDKDLQRLTCDYVIVPHDAIHDSAKIGEDGLYHFSDTITFNEAFFETLKIGND